MKKAITILIMLFMVFTAPISCLAIGEESSDQWNLMGDIQSEKEVEGQLFSIIGLGLVGGSPGAGPFAIFTAGTGATSLALAQIAKPENSTWENWPMGRYTFHHVPVEWFPSTQSISDKAMAGAGDMIANMIFDLSKMITKLSINILVIAYNTKIITGMIGWISDGLTNIFVGSELSKILLLIGTILLLVYAVFRFLRGQAMDTLKATLIAVLAVGSVFFFTANAQQIIGSVSETTDALAGVFLGATSNYTSADRNINIDDPVDRGMVAAGQAIWETIITRPWAVTMFGTADESRLLLTASEYDDLTAKKEIFPEASWAKIKPGMRIDTLHLAVVGDGLDAVANTLGQPNSKFLFVPRSIKQGAEIDHGDHPGSVVGYMPSKVSSHIKTACLTLLPSFCLAALTATVALSILVCQAVLVVMLLVLPIALFALMIPETGWSLASQYFKTVTGFFMIKLIYGLYLSLTLTITSGMTMSLMENNIGLAMMVASALFLGAAIYRKKALNMVFDSLKKGKTSFNAKIDTQQLKKYNLKMARRLGLSDAVSDWWFSRKR